MHISEGDPHLPGPNDLRITDVLGRWIDGVGQSYEQMVVILADGLGAVPLADHFGHASVLRGYRDEIEQAFTTVPSTTAAAITSFATGAPPGATRMVGYSVAYRGRAMNLLAFENGPDPTVWQEVPTHFERLADRSVSSAVISPPSFAGSGLTLAALRGARHVGAVSMQERIDAAMRELQAGTRVVYFYWSDIDHEGHRHGVNSEQWRRALEEFDAGIGHLLTRISHMRAADRIAVMLTADHGMVDVRPDDLIDVAHTPELREGVELIAGETRSVHLHTQPGRAAEVLTRWEEYLGERAWIVPADALPGVIGKGPGVQVVGDAMVMSRGRYGIVDSRVQSEGAMALIGVHGSLTEAEMMVPVVRLA